MLVSPEKRTLTLRMGNDEDMRVQDITGQFFPDTAVFYDVTQRRESRTCLRCEQVPTGPALAIQTRTQVHRRQPGAFSKPAAQRPQLVAKIFHYLPPENPLALAASAGAPCYGFWHLGLGQ